jgi:hypothetical protein
VAFKACLSAQSLPSRRGRPRRGLSDASDGTLAQNLQHVLECINFVSLTVMYVSGDLERFLSKGSAVTVRSFYLSLLC